MLITADVDLATSDAAYVEVCTAVDQLTAAANQALSMPGVKPALDQKLLVTGVGEVAAVVAAAIPSVLSLFTVHRAISSYATTIDDDTAMAAVAGELADIKVQLDDFRLVPQGELVNHVRSLQDKRSDLLERKIATVMRVLDAPSF